MRFAYKKACIWIQTQWSNIRLCFRDLSYLNEDKYFKSYNFVSVSTVIPKCFSLCIQCRLNIFQFWYFRKWRRREFFIYTKDQLKIKIFDITHVLVIEQWTQIKERRYGAIVFVQKQGCVNHATKRRLSE